jgi:hypothetical protein
MVVEKKPLTDKPTATGKGSVIPAVVSTTPPRNSQKRSLYIGGAAAIVVLIIVGFVWYRHDHNHNAQVSAAVVCTVSAHSSTLIQAAGAMYSDNIPAQAAAVNKIKEIPNYQRDPNCLYPMIIYYINTEDTKDANLYLSDYQAVYNSRKGLSGEYGTPKSIATLRSGIAAIKKTTTSQVLVSVPNSP